MKNIAPTKLNYLRFKNGLQFKGKPLKKPDQRKKTK